MILGGGGLYLSPLIQDHLKSQSLNVVSILDKNSHLFLFLFILKRGRGLYLWDIWSICTYIEFRSWIYIQSELSLILVYKYCFYSHAAIGIWKFDNKFELYKSLALATCDVLVPWFGLQLLAYHNNSFINLTGPVWDHLFIRFLPNVR